MSGPTSGHSEVAGQLDLSVIRYSRVWEDYRILVKGLEISSQDSLLIITSSGDNVLNLLLEEPQHITAVDMSPAQNSILELKLAAIHLLSYDEFLQLLGVTPSINRLQLFEKVRSRLPQYAQDFWLTRTAVIEAGIVDSGRLGHYFSKYSNEILPAVVSDKLLDAVFNATSMEEQKQAYEKLPLKEMEGVTREFVSFERQKKEGRSSAQLKYTEKSSEEVTHELWQRLGQVLSSLPASDNYYMSWFMRGNKGFNPATKPQFAPPYLTRTGFDKLKGLLDRVSVVTGTIEDYLINPAITRPTKAVLSDVFEYMSATAADNLFQLLAQSMAPGSRIAYWMLYVPRYPSSALENQLEHLSQLSLDLHKEDRVFFYSDFAVFRIKSY